VHRDLCSAAGAAVSRDAHPPRLARQHAPGRCKRILSGTRPFERPRRSAAHERRTSSIEAWVGKRWRPIAQSDYEASARRLFNQASYVCPVETLLRLRRGSDVLIKMPADGLGNVRE
jgi:hypothetical protein